MGPHSRAGERCKLTTLGRMIRSTVLAVSIVVCGAWGPHVTLKARQVPADHTEGPAILMLAVNDPSRPWVPLITEGFQDVVDQAPEPPTVYLEYLDTARFGEEDYIEAYREWLRRKYRNRRIDLLVARGQESVEFLARARGEPWPSVPVLYGEFGALTIDISESLPGATGVILESQTRYALQVMKALLPDTERVAFLYGGSEVERARYAGFTPLVRESNLGLEPIDVGGLAMDDLLERVAHLPERTVALFLGILVDGAGRSFAHGHPCELIAAAINRPLFGLYRHDFGCGIVGGSLVDFTEAGRVLGEQALKRLQGESVALVTIPAARHAALAFDARQLERWKIPESVLPAGSSLHFREPSLWRDYRPQVIAALALGLVPGLVIGLLFERHRRHVAERNSRRHMATAAHLDRRAVLGELAAALTHQLNQPLGAIVHNAEAAELMLDAGSLAPEDLRAILADIRKDDARAAQIMQRMRDLLRKHELSLAPLNLNELAADTADMIALEAAAHGVTVDLRLAPGLPKTAGDRVHLQQVLLNGCSTVCRLSRVDQNTIDGSSYGPPSATTVSRSWSPTAASVFPPISCQESSSPSLRPRATVSVSDCRWRAPSSRRTEERSAPRTMDEGPRSVSGFPSRARTLYESRSTIGRARRRRRRVDAIGVGQASASGRLRGVRLRLRHGVPAPGAAEAPGMRRARCAAA